MSILALTSNTLIGTPASGNIEYDGQFFGTDSNASRAQMQRIVGATAVSVSGTSVDFTGLPSWIKRITVMFQGVSTSGTSNLVVRAGTSGGIDSTNYTSNRGTINNTSVFVATTTTGFDVAAFASAAILNKGNVILNNITGNVWVSSGCISDSGTQISSSAGTVSLAGVLDRIRITTVNGTDTFDAGTINILYEG